VVSYTLHWGTNQTSIILKSVRCVTVVDLYYALFVFNTQYYVIVCVCACVCVCVCACVCVCSILTIYLLCFSIEVYICMQFATIQPARKFSNYQKTIFPVFIFI
jgi:hypothetical protein